MKAHQTPKGRLFLLIFHAGVILAAGAIATTLSAFYVKTRAQMRESLLVDTVAVGQGFQRTVNNQKAFLDYLATSAERGELNEELFRLRVDRMVKGSASNSVSAWLFGDGTVRVTASQGAESLNGTLRLGEEQARAFELAQSTGSGAISEPFKLSPTSWAIDIYVPLAEGAAGGGVLMSRLEMGQLMANALPEVLSKRHAIAAMLNDGTPIAATPADREVDTSLAQTISLEPQFRTLSLQLLPYRSAAVTFSTAVLVISLIFLLFLTSTVLWLSLTLRRRRALEYDLQDSELRFRTLASTASFGIWLVDDREKTLFKNSAMDDILRVRASYHADSTAIREVLPLECVNALAELKDSQLVPKVCSYQTVLGEDSATARTVIMNAARMPSLNGYTKSLLFTCVDITPQVRMEEERRQFEAHVQHSQKLESLGVLAAGIAHDFNNLLVGILGNASLALQEMPQQDPSRNAVEKVQAAALRASDLTRQLLNYSGKGHFRKELVSLTQTVEEMAPLISMSNQKKGAMQLALDANISAVYADITQIQQVIMNLAINALEAIDGPMDSVRITTGVMEAVEQYLDECVTHEKLPPGAYVFIEVSDTGCGMPQTTQDRVFDPFFTTKFTGRGLGMSSVLGIVRGHGGAIKIDSRQGTGTTIRVLFPKVAGDFPAREQIVEIRTPATTPAARSAAIRTVLVVDDEETVRDFAKVALERAGYQVITAGDGREGVNTFLAEGDRIDLIVLDITMPELNGEEVYTEVRKISGKLPILFSSGFDEGRGQEVTHNKPFTLFLRKPYRIGDLVAMVNRGMELNEAEVEAP